MPAPFTGMVQITGGAFQDAEGNPIANGKMTLRLSSDQQVPSIGQTAASIVITAALDANGNIQGTTTGNPVYVWPNDKLQDTTSYYFVRVYNAQGQLVWGPQKQQISSPSPFNVSTWVPNLAV